MHVLEAHGLLAALSDDELHELRPPDLKIDGLDWLDDLAVSPLVVTACCSLSGQLDEARTLDDLRAAAAHFRSLWDAEVIDPDRVGPELADIFGQLEEAILAHAMQLGTRISRDAGFSQAELN